MTERNFALFDVDNTIYQGYVIFDLAKAQVESELLPARCRDQLYKDTELYNSGRIAYETFARQAMTHWAEGLVGKPYNKVLTHAQELLRINRGKFFNFFEVLTEQLVKTHDLYLVTAEPEFVCQAISSLFPITGFAASKFYKRGRFTKAVSILATSQDKDMAIDLMLARHSNRNSIAFGDAISDEMMLEKAVYKLCIDHPKSTLRAVALSKRPENGWFVVQPDSVVKCVSELLKR